MYLILWRYRVHSRHREAFEAFYGAGGEWARFFRSFDGYLKTELLRDTVIDEYMTIDYWRDADTYARFRNAGSSGYQELDQTSGVFTREETFIGAFTLEQSDANRRH